MQTRTRLVSGALLATGLLVSTVAIAAQPIPKLGAACPFGYRDEPKSGYCMPYTNNAKAVIPIKNGMCPSGFHSEPKSGYCVSNG